MVQYANQCYLKSNIYRTMKGSPPDSKLRALYQKIKDIESRPLTRDSDYEEAYDALNKEFQWLSDHDRYNNGYGVLRRNVRVIRDDGTALCSHCEVWLPLTEFYTASGRRPLNRYVFVLGNWYDKPMSRCKNCFQCYRPKDCECKENATLRAQTYVTDKELKDLMGYHNPNTD